MKGCALLLCLWLLTACGNNGDRITSEAKQQGDQYIKEVLRHPSWSKNSSIYTVNVRHFSPEGSLSAIRKDLPRLKSLGVGVLLLMPIQPLAIANRRGSFGSYYSVRDHKSVNPDFGSMEELKLLINEAHSYGIKVAIDWVAHQSGVDHYWVSEHRDYYFQDSAGHAVRTPETTMDALPLNYQNESLRTAMIDAMKFWVEEAKVDGFRCLHANAVPADFWVQARKELNKVSSEVFMIADAEVPEHHLEAFDISASKELFGLMNGIATKSATLSELDDYFAKEDTQFVANSYRMTYTSDYAENALYGTAFERFGDGQFAFAVLAYNVGTPMVYNGQETGAERQMKAFDKDTIAWNGYAASEFYNKLLKVHSEEEALWNGPYGGKMKRIKTENDDVVYAFIRRQGKSEVLTILNLSPSPTTVVFGESVSGDFTSIFNQFKLTIFANGELPLEAWGYQVFVRNKQ